MPWYFEIEIVQQNRLYDVDEKKSCFNFLILKSLIKFQTNDFTQKNELKIFKLLSDDDYPIEINLKLSLSLYIYIFLDILFVYFEYIKNRGENNLKISFSICPMT